MMEALKGLVPTNAAQAKTDAGDATALSAASDSKDPAKALKEAAYGFAHELFQALKAAGASGPEASGESGGCRPHRCGGYGEQAGGASAYGGLAQGLQRLAQAVVAAPAASSAALTPSTTSTTDAADTTPPASPLPSTPAPEAVADAVPAKPAESATAGSASSITIHLTLNFGAASGADSGAAASTESPLLAAFKKLMLALNPKAGATSSTEGATAATADTKKPAELLQAFLEKLAKALGAEGSMAFDAMPAKGSLVNLSA